MASVVVIATVVAAIAVIGSPSRQRLLRLDERRVNDLEAIASQVRVYRNQHGGMPASLATLSAEPGVRVPRDPASAQPYGYEALGGADYRLCARFDTDTADTTDPQGPPRAAAASGNARTSRSNSRLPKWYAETYSVANSTRYRKASRAERYGRGFGTGTGNATSA
jgi:type II secretory pathway pseudopilin PulG